MTVFNHTIKRLLGSKLKLLILLVLPVAFAVMFVMVNKTSMKIVIADNDESKLSQALVSQIKTMKGVQVSVISDADIDDKIISFQADYAIIIAKSFEKQILTNQPPFVSEFYTLDKEKLFYARALVNGFVADLQALSKSAGYDEQKFEAAYAAYENGHLALATSGQTEDKLTQSRGALGFLVQFMLYMSVITAGIILEDKASGVYFRVFFAPVSLKRYYLENLLAFLLVSSLQAAIVLSILGPVLGLPLGAHPLAIYLLFIAFGLVCISFGMWLITLFRKPVHAYTSIVFLVTPFVMLGGCYWPTSYMPDILVKISKFMPTTWAMQAVDKVLTDGAALGAIGLELLILMLFAAIFLAAGLVKKVEVSRQSG